MTEKLLSPLRTRPWPERWLTRVLGAALSAAAYLLCLPWDLRNRIQTEGGFEETTPVTGIGVVLLAAALLLLAAYFGHRDALAWPLLLVAVPPATLMYVSLRTYPGPPDGFANAWPLAWAFFTLLLAAGVLVAASVARQFRADLVDEELSLAHRP
jgi:ABC-type Na+ efflux pump permease subunit